MGPWGYKVAKLELRRKRAFPSWSLGTRAKSTEILSGFFKIII